MDANLKLLAETSLMVDEAEQAIEEQAYSVAEERVEAAVQNLGSLRERWPEMGRVERHIIGRAARPVRDRLDEVRRAIPTRRALSVTTDAPDPEQEIDPETLA